MRDSRFALHYFFWGGGCEGGDDATRCRRLELSLRPDWLSRCNILHTATRGGSS